MSLLPRPLVLLLAGALLGSLALVSAPARAGRASACKAPPFAVPTETQRAVDAAINAHVIGTGGGGVSSTVESRTEYETTTLSQDAAARAWFEYTLCMKLAKKMISQDLHDELLRGLVDPTSQVQIATAAAIIPESQQGQGVTTGPPMAPTTAALTPNLLIGTWQVTSRYRSGSCPENMGGGNHAYTWLVSQDTTGQVVVVVQGKSGFGELHGAISEGDLRLGAIANRDGAPAPERVGTATDGPQFSVMPRTDFDLRLDGADLVGTREVVTWTSTLSDDETSYTVLPCVLRYDVRGRR